MEIRGYSQGLQEIFNLRHVYLDTACGQVTINCTDAEGGKSLRRNGLNALTMQSSDLQAIGDLGTSQKRCDAHSGDTLPI